MNTNRIGNFKRTSLKYGRFALKCLPSAVVTMILVVIVYALKGIWPLGNTTIAYMDMWQANVPIYYHLYDFLHGSKPLLYDWYTGLGINMSETTAIVSLLSPFNLLFYFTSRSGILKFLSIFTLIKFMAMSFSMSAFLNYKFGKLDKFWITLFSVAYSLCGFSIMYYTNSQWLDSAALFPLLLITLDRLYTPPHRILPYILMLALYLVTNAYIGIITLLFLFVAAGLYIPLMVEKGNRGRMVINLGAGTFSAIGISAFILLPFYAQTSSSARLSGDFWNTLVAAYNDKTGQLDIQKLWMLWGTALAFAIIITGIIRFRKEHRTVAYTIGIIVSVTIQIACENINKLWHGISYQCFPMRFGFITAFVLWGAAAYYLCRLCGSRDLSHLFSNLLSKSNGRLYAIGCAILCAGISGGLAFAISKIFLSQPQDNMRITSIIIFALVFALFLLLFNKPVPKVIVGCLCSVMIAELLAGGYLYIGKPYIDPYFGPKQDQSFTKTLATIRNFDGMYQSEIDRIRNSDTSFLDNYPFLLQRAAISNWTHTIPATRQQTIKNLGYSTIYTRMVDGGGTIFSDALMNIKQVFTGQTLSDDAYTFIGNTADSNIYNCNYTLPLSLTFPSEFFDNYKTSEDPLVNQRAIAEALGADGLVNIIVSNDAINDELVEKNVTDNVAEYTITVSGTQQLYLYSTSTMNVAVNGEILVCPDNGDNSNINYPASYNNGIFDLGSFTDETVVVTLTYSDPAKMKSTIAMMDHSLMSDFCAKYSGIETNASVNGRTLSLNVTCPEDGRMLFLPVAYDEGFSCKVNGQPAKVTPVFGDLVAVPVGKGDSTVSLHFTPKGFDIGVIISLVSLALVVIASLISRIKKPKVNGGVLTAANVVFMIIWIAMALFLYVAPFIIYIYKWCICLAG